MDLNEKLFNNYRLLCNIVRQSEDGKDFKVDLSKIEDIIVKKIPDTLKKNAPEDFYELYSDFKAEYDRFRDFIMYEKLIGKNVVALGGGFSSGKSSFLNAVMKRTVLPENIDPSTTVPTYIVKGDEHAVEGINVFDTKVTMELKDIKRITHDFGMIEDEDYEKIADRVTLGHVLESIFFSTTFQKYENLAFLDTPGYSKPDSEKYSAKTDEQIARGQLNSSNYILWFVQADAGTITEEDIKFIKSLREGIPMLVILNKADKKTVGDLKKIIERIKLTLNMKGVRYIDVLAFSRNTEFDNEEQTEFIEDNKNKILQCMADWDKKIYESKFAINFKRLFVKCKEFYEDEIDEESSRLYRLNTSITRLGAEEVDDAVIEPLRALAESIKRNITALRKIADQLEELAEEFFEEIHFIANKVGIQMPEPSELEILKETAHDPVRTMKAYVSKNKSASRGETAGKLRDFFENNASSLKLSSQKNGGNLAAMLATCFSDTKDRIDLTQE